MAALGMIALRARTDTVDPSQRELFFATGVTSTALGAALGVGGTALLTTPRSREGDLSPSN